METVATEIMFCYLMEIMILDDKYDVEFVFSLRTSDVIITT